MADRQHYSSPRNSANHTSHQPFQGRASVTQSCLSNGSDGKLLSLLDDVHEPSRHSRSSYGQHISLTSRFRLRSGRMPHSLPYSLRMTTTAWTPPRAMHHWVSIGYSIELFLSRIWSRQGQVGNGQVHFNNLSRSACLDTAFYKAFSESVLSKSRFESLKKWKHQNGI